MYNSKHLIKILVQNPREIGSIITDIAYYVIQLIPRLILSKLRYHRICRTEVDQQVFHINPIIRKAKHRRNKKKYWQLFKILPVCKTLSNEPSYFQWQFYDEFIFVNVEISRIYWFTNNRNSFPLSRFTTMERRHNSEHRV